MNIKMGWYKREMGIYVRRDIYVDWYYVDRVLCGLGWHMELVVVRWSAAFGDPGEIEPGAV
jgi:hypothetical protein